MVGVAWRFRAGVCLSSRLRFPEKLTFEREPLKGFIHNINLRWLE